jgi:hypothetical protein
MRGVRELKYKLQDTTLTSNVNQTLSNLLSQTNKVKKTVEQVSVVANAANDTANNPSLSLEDLTDVTITSPSEGQAVVRNAGNTGWVNGSVGGLSLATSGYGGFWSAGIHLPAFGNSVTSITVSVTTNQVCVFQFVLPYSITISTVSTAITTGSSGKHVNFGIYSAAGAKLIDSGAISAATSSTQEVVSITPVTLPAGVYYFAQSADSSSVQVEGFAANASSLFKAQALANGVYVAIAANSTSAGVMPSTLGTLSYTSYISNALNMAGAFFGV